MLTFSVLLFRRFETVDKKGHPLRGIAAVQKAMALAIKASDKVGCKYYRHARTVCCTVYRVTIVTRCHMI